MYCISLNTATIFFVQITLTLVDGGNDGGQRGREHNVTPLPPLALKWLQMPLTDGCPSKNTCNTHALFSAGSVPLIESGLLKGERRNYTPWVWSNSTILRGNTASLVLKAMKGVEFPTQVIRILLAERKYETLTKAVQSPHNFTFQTSAHTHPHPTNTNLLVFNVHIKAVRGCACCKRMGFQKSKI